MPDDPIENRIRSALREVSLAVNDYAVNPSDPDRSSHRFKQRRRYSGIITVAAIVATIVGASVALGAMRPPTNPVSVGSALESNSPAITPVPETSTGPFPTTPRRSKTPYATRPSNDEITRVTERLARLENRDGFGSVTVNFDAATVSLRWAGAVPADVDSEIGTSPEGVHVTLIRTRYSQAYLLAEGADLASEFPDVEITGWMVTRELNGLIVDVVRPQPSTESELRSATSVPLRVNPVESGPVQLGGP